MKTVASLEILNFLISKRRCHRLIFDWSKNASSLSDIFVNAFNTKSTKIKSGLIDTLNALDKKMAPTDTYKIASAVATAVRHHIKTKI